MYSLRCPGQCEYIAISMSRIRSCQAFMSIASGQVSAMHGTRRSKFYLRGPMPRRTMSWESRYDNTCVCSMDKRGVQSGERKRALAGVLIVVEGVNDMRRIRAFLDVDVYVLGSATRAGDSDLIGELQHLGTVYKRIILLLDPDVAGRQARNEIDRRVDGCWHAFIPVASAQSRVNKKYKDIGDVGVEHASSAAIQAAIRRSRKSRRENVFSREYLISQGVVAPMHQRVRGIPLEYL